jgi:hypothetical protein
MVSWERLHIPFPWLSWKPKLQVLTIEVEERADDIVPAKATIAVSSHFLPLLYPNASAISETMAMFARIPRR